MSEAPPDRLPAVTPAELAALARLYDDVDGAIAAFLRASPSARCPAGCHRCCTRAAPLVSDVEAARVEAAVARLDAGAQEGARARSRELRGQLEAGESDDVACPLLQGGRCLVYADRPYLCRSFGHSARRLEDGAARAFTCELLQDALRSTAPPLLEARSAALRRAVGRVVDSYLPIWLSTAPAQRVAQWRGDDLAVVVATTDGRVRR